MADAELIEQIRAQVKSMKSNSNAAHSSEGSYRSRLSPVVSGVGSEQTSSSSNRTPQERIWVLDVGGVEYKTTSKTLKCTSSSYLSDLMNGVVESVKTEEGHLFIDRNGELFAFVLEYLRNYVQNEGTEFVVLPTELSKLKALKREAEFYSLPGLTSQINSVLTQRELDRERFQNEVDAASSVIVNEEENQETEFDVIFDSISSFQCKFSEASIQDLINRVNHRLALKEAEGYKINSSKSDLIFDASKICPYVLFLQITLMRDRKLQEQFPIPVSTPPLERIRQMPFQLPTTSYFHRGGDLGTLMELQGVGIDASGSTGTMESVESSLTPPPVKSKRMIPSRSPRKDGHLSGARFPLNVDSISEAIYPTPVDLSEQQDRQDVQMRWNYHPHFGSLSEWNEGLDFEVQQPSLSPRGVTRYQPKSSTRSPVTPTNEYQVRWKE